MTDDDDTKPVRTRVVKCRCGDGQIGSDGRCACGLRAPGAMPLKITPGELLAEITMRTDELAALMHRTPRWRVFRRLALCESRLDALGHLITRYRQAQEHGDVVPVRMPLDPVPFGTEEVGDRG